MAVAYFCHMDYQQTIDYLFSQLPMFQKVGGVALKYDLQNINVLMKALDNPHQKVKTIHVGGTNGKGSTVHMMASVLQAAGYKTGLFTSPHLKSFTERIKINGEEITQQKVIEFVERISDIKDDFKPSFFEITFAMAMDYFCSQQVDIAIIEVGMGGRLDSTNIITPEISLITNISKDHQQFLGDTLPAIAAEKAGIFKEGVEVVIGEYQHEVADVFIEKAKAMACPLMFANKRYHIEQANEARYSIFDKNNLLLEGILPDLKGTYQVKNMITAVAGLLQLKEKNEFQISAKALRSGLENVVRNTGIKGRWQVLKTKPLTITDTAHNTAGIKEVINSLYWVNKAQLHIVWGMVNDKEIDEILNLLPPSARYYFVAAKIPRALSPHHLSEVAQRHDLLGEVYHSVMDGVANAFRNANKEDTIFIGGSTFVVAEIENL